MQHDQSGQYPHGLHQDLARDGWIGIALPEELGGAGLGISEATMMLHTIAECVLHFSINFSHWTLKYWEEGCVEVEQVLQEPNLFMQMFMLRRYE